LPPPSVSVAAPTLVSPPVPPIAPDRVTAWPLVSKVAPLLPIAASREEMSVVLPVAHCRPPPFRVIGPVPRLLPAAKLINPPVTVVPPE
jgi:hypothetical protein